MIYRYFVYYIGFIVGKIYSEKGSGVNILCLLYDLDFVLLDFFIFIYGGYFLNIWGVEYEFNYCYIVEDDDLLCVVC